MTTAILKSAASTPWNLPAHKAHRCTCFDEAELRDSARRFRSALDAHYPGESSIIYASKAFSNVALFRLLAEEGVGFDVVSGGELATTQAADVDLSSVHFPRQQQERGRT